MGTRTEHAPGTLSWVSLGTTDTSGAKTFYGALFGWEAEEIYQDETGEYAVFHLGPDHVAGVTPIPADRRAAGVPPGWLSFVTVESADGAAARARELGGTVVLEPEDVDGAGRMAIIDDPTGATFAVWQPGDVNGAERVNDPGCLCWNDLTTPDVEAGAAFYRGLFGWEVEEIPGSGGYRMIRNGGRTNGGMMPSSMAGGDQRSQWLPYFNAGLRPGDLAAALARVQEGGGRVAAGPREVPSGRIAVALAPQGAVFALWEGPKVDD